MTPVESDEFELSTGKRIYAHNLMLSVGYRDGKPYGLAFGYGADGDILLADHDYIDEVDYFTKEEQIEVAEYAIMLWTGYLKMLR